RSVDRRGKDVFLRPAPRYLDGRPPEAKSTGYAREPPSRRADRPVVSGTVRPRRATRGRLPREGQRRRADPAGLDVRSDQPLADGAVRQVEDGRLRQQEADLRTVRADSQGRQDAGAAADLRGAEQRAERLQDVREAGEGEGPVLRGAARGRQRDGGA